MIDDNLILQLHNLRSHMNFDFLLLTNSILKLRRRERMNPDNISDMSSCVLSIRTGRRGSDGNSVNPCVLPGTHRLHHLHFHAPHHLRLLANTSACPPTPLFAPPCAAMTQMNVLGHPSSPFTFLTSARLSHAV